MDDEIDIEHVYDYELAIHNITRLLDVIPESYSVYEGSESGHPMITFKRIVEDLFSGISMHYFLNGYVWDDQSYEKQLVLFRDEMIENHKKLCFNCVEFATEKLDNARFWLDRQLSAS